MKDRVYVCHTYYHAYIAVVKELNMPKEWRGAATLILSTMSNDFENMDKRAIASGLFEDVLMFDEQVDNSSPAVMKYHKDRGNTFLNLLQRVIYTKKLGALQKPYVPVDFREYKDIYVFCDSDPIGYYLNYMRIPYHAVEDGLDTVVYHDSARTSNTGHFALKAWMAAHNLIFIENGYSKYCIDMELNDKSKLKYPMEFYKELPREKLISGVAEEDKKIILKIFMEDADRLLEQMAQADLSKPSIMVLTEPLCELDVRRKLFSDIVQEYGAGANVFIKPHPRDLLDYEEVFEDAIVLKGRFPMEVMNDIPGLKVDKLISVFTVVDAIKFAKEKIFLGEDFMDRYEDPAIHRPNETI